MLPSTDGTTTRGRILSSLFWTTHPLGVHLTGTTRPETAPDTSGIAGVTSPSTGALDFVAVHLRSGRVFTAGGKSEVAPIPAGLRW